MSKDVNKSIFDLIKNHNHEQIIFCNDESLGLKAIIGIHNTVLGPAIGGTRMWNYRTSLLQENIEKAGKFKTHNRVQASC